MATKTPKTKSITGKQWRCMTEAQRKRCLRFAAPNMDSYYNQFDDTSNLPKEDDMLWKAVFQKQIVVDTTGNVKVGIHHMLFKVAI